MISFPFLGYAPKPTRTLGKGFSVRGRDLYWWNTRSRQCCHLLRRHLDAHKQSPEEMEPETLIQRSFE
jgi:hypothetical protein